MSKYIFGFLGYFVVGTVIVGSSLGICYQFSIENKSALMLIGYWAFSLSAAVSRRIKP